MTFGAAMNILLSIAALILTLCGLDTALRIFRRWKTSDEEERYELEKGFYLTFSAAVIVLGIRLFLVPLYFWTMQSLIPAIPGAMCLWGVFNALPELTWPALFLKFVLPVTYIGWLLLARINSECKTNPLMRNLMAVFLLLSPLLIIDSAADILIFFRLNPIEVSCCSNAIDVGPRPIPIWIGTVPAQNFLILVFFGLSVIFSISLILALRYKILEWISLMLTLPLAGTLVITITEVLAPMLLRLPFHHCPFCLLLQNPPSLIFTSLFWFALAAPWIILITKTLGRKTDEARSIELRLRNVMLTYSGVAMIVAITIVLVDLLTAMT